MVHHIPRFLRRLRDVHSKVALVVVDCLGMCQWPIIRESLQTSVPGIRLNEGAVFAWVPTLTSFSRQALLSGRPPFGFASSLFKTSKEEQEWSDFWLTERMPTGQIFYSHYKDSDASFDEIRETIEHRKPLAAAIIVGTVDEMTHGTVLGWSALHTQVRVWMKEGRLVRLLEFLLDAGYRIVISADHGNVQTTGFGRPSEGVMAEVRGERCRIYPDAALRSKTAETYVDAVQWPPIGLPQGTFPLLAPSSKAFTTVNDRIVCHGGASLEETVVPLIEVMRS